jgi:membrane-associated protease RseP (regulator of RpoE activity)
VGFGITITPSGAVAQTSRMAQIIEEPSPLLLQHSSSQGYLGVLVGDVDSESAPKLKLKEVRGAVVTLIDHDAPAAQAGLRINDVVLELNGQAVEGAEQFSRMLREIPAGRKVSLLISRDGNAQTLAVQLADRKAMEQDVWNKIGNGGEEFSPVGGMGILAGGGDAPLAGGFHMPLFGSSLNVGALVEPLTSQMAEYLGVEGGLMIKQVARKSEAAAAGLKAFDVILKVGPESIATVSDWDRALRANQGKPVQVTVLRDKKQQTLTLQVDSKHRHAMLEDLCPEGSSSLMAGIDPELAQQLGSEVDAAADAMRQQAQALRDQLGTMPVISPEQAEQIRQQAEKLRESFKDQNFKIDQKQLDQLKQQMDEFRKNFKPEDFKIDPKQMDELKRQMDQLKRQMKEMQAQGFGNHV